MAKEYGYKVTGTITNKKGICRFGHKVGQKFEVSARDTGGLCGYLYHTVFPFILMMQYGGRFAELHGWKEKGELLEFECPDIENAVRIKLSRED